MNFDKCVMALICHYSIIQLFMFEVYYVYILFLQGPTAFFFFFNSEMVPFFGEACRIILSCHCEFMTKTCALGLKVSDSQGGWDSERLLRQPV